MLNRVVLGIWYLVLVLRYFTSDFIFHLSQSYKLKNLFLNHYPVSNNQYLLN